MRQFCIAYTASRPDHQISSHRVTGIFRDVRTNNSSSTERVVPSASHLQRNAYAKPHPLWWQKVSTLDTRGRTLTADCTADVHNPLGKLPALNLSKAQHCCGNTATATKYCDQPLTSPACVLGSHRLLQTCVRPESREKNGILRLQDASKACLQRRHLFNGSGIIRKVQWVTKSKGSTAMHVGCFAGIFTMRSS